MLHFSTSSRRILYTKLFESERLEPLSKLRLPVGPFTDFGCKALKVRGTKKLMLEDLGFGFSVIAFVVTSIRLFCSCPSRSTNHSKPHLSEEDTEDLVLQESSSYGNDHAYYEVFCLHTRPLPKRANRAQTDTVESRP
jgi:hypothetical protein